MSTALSKRELRQRWAQLRSLLCSWDPIGVMDIPDWPLDEYDCLIGPLLTLLQAGADCDAIGSHLRKEIDEHFGLSPEHYDFRVIAARMRTWFDQGWRDLAQPVSIFVALLDVGVEVWRPVRARPLLGGLFRIVGVDADVSEETWQFPAGAIVRCEERRLGDGTLATTAVEQIQDAC